MIKIEQITVTELSTYDTIPMRVEVRSVLVPHKHDDGLGGITLRETPVVPYTKDYRAFESVTDLPTRFDVTSWGFFMARDAATQPVGGAIVAARTPGVNMLHGRDDLAVLWDIRVDDAHKRRGVGAMLLRTAEEWCRRNGLSELHIETQNTNVPACRFYRKHSATLCAYDENAYAHEPDARHEIQLIWRKPL